MIYPTRVEPADFENLNDLQRERAEKMGRRGTAKSSKIMRTMMNYPHFLKAFARLGLRSNDGTSLTRRLYELGAMRTVWLLKCEYLWSRHQGASLRTGITDEELYEVAVGPSSPKLQGLDRLVVQAIDEFHFDHRLSDETWDAFSAFGPDAVMDVLAIYGNFVILGCAANSVGVDLEDDEHGFRPELLVLLNDDGFPFLPPLRTSPTGERHPVRLQPVDHANLAPPQREQVDVMGERGRPDGPRILRAALNYPHFVGGLTPLLKRVLDRNSLPQRLVHIGALRAAWLYGSEYLWAEERKACLKLGLTEADISEIAAGASSRKLTGEDRAMVLAMDELHGDSRLSDETWGAFDQFGPDAVMDVILVHGLYCNLACAGNTMGVELEAGASGFPAQLRALT